MKQLFITLAFLTLVFTVNSINAQEIPDQLQQRIRLYQVERDKIREELKLKINTQEDLSLEEKNQIMNQWRNQNTERIASQKKLAQEIKTQLQAIIREKQELMKDQPAEEREQAMQQWMTQNRLHLSAANGNGDMNDAVLNFRLQARERIKQQQSDLEKQQLRLHQDSGSGDGKNSGKKGGS